MSEIEKRNRKAQRYIERVADRRKRKLVGIILWAAIVLMALLCILFPLNAEAKEPQEQQLIVISEKTAEENARMSGSIQSIPINGVHIDVPKKEYLGKFTATAYCPCVKCCGEWSNPDNPLTVSGATAKAGVTIATDWNAIPNGTTVYIDGIGERIAQDKPAKSIIKRYNGKIIDVFFNTHAEALNFGKRTVDVWMVRK